MLSGIKNAHMNDDIMLVITVVSNTEWRMSASLLLTDYYIIIQLTMLPCIRLHVYLDKISQHEQRFVNYLL